MRFGETESWCLGGECSTFDVLEYCEKILRSIHDYVKANIARILWGGNIANCIANCTLAGQNHNRWIWRGSSGRSLCSDLLLESFWLICWVRGRLLSALKKERKKNIERTKLKIPCVTELFRCVKIVRLNALELRFGIRVCYTLCVTDCVLHTVCYRQGKGREKWNFSAQVHSREWKKNSSHALWTLAVRPPNDCKC